MPVRHYGIYLAYPPTVDLRGEGLGRHLAMFLKGAEGLSDIRFTIVCPSWTKKTLALLFESEQVPSGVYKIVAPEGAPYALRVFEAVRRYRGRHKRQGRISRIAQWTGQFGERLWERLTGRAVAVYDALTFTRFLVESAWIFVFIVLIACLALPFALLFVSVRAIASLADRLVAVSQRKWRTLLARVLAILSAPQQDSWVLRLFEKMQQEEIHRMHAKIDALKHVNAWYCPTAFWPSFHDIKTPRLMCVPDVVLADFPVGFSSVGGDRFLSSFESVELAIRKGEHFVTYSQAVKWGTLVDRYAVAASKITVVPHAPSLLSRRVEISGFPDAEATSRHYCKTLFRLALQHSTNPSYTTTFQNENVRFLFYASQCRPNKNILMLLRAFEFLLRKRHFGRKLILTGHPEHVPEIGRFVIDHRLENDVIFVHGLKSSELAACYKLAELAVNPTLSEGGCPFTFTEALSVGTPVVMSRIPVTEEVLDDPRLQEATFFDPFDWSDCAKRIEWAINHRDELLNLQLDAYGTLCKRTWTDVVAEHVKVLDEISSDVVAA
jgi:glycosyltransferase involved in cell wall biosynthesis